MMSASSSRSSRLTCIALSLDLRGLFHFGRRLMEAGQRPILANRIELAADFARRFGLDIVVVQVPHGNLGAAVREITRRLEERGAGVRLLLEVPEPQAKGFPTGGAVQYFSPADPPARVRALIDAATFADGITGSVAHLDLVAYLQLLMMSRYTRALEIRGLHAGRIYVREGELVHAVCGPVVGDAALYKLLGQRAGSFVEIPVPDQLEQSISGGGETLLLEAMRLRDEQSHGKAR